MDDYIIKRFETPDEVREFDKGKYEVINLPGMTIGKATYYKGGNGLWTSLHSRGQNFARLNI